MRYGNGKRCATVIGFSVWQLSQVRGKRYESRCEWVRWMCSIWSRVRTIASLRECKFGEDHGTGIGPTGRSLLWRDSWFWQSSCHFYWSWMNVERSELVGRSQALTRGKFVTYLAALSTISLPAIPQWPETHMKVILVLSVLWREDSKIWIRVTRGWEESRPEISK